MSRIQPHGKAHAYHCPGGHPGVAIRPIGPPPRPCDHCGADLTYVIPTVEDHNLFVRDMLARLRGNIENPPALDGE